MLKTKERINLVLSMKDIDDYYKKIPDDLLLWFAEDRVRNSMKCSLKDYIENWFNRDQMQREAEHCKDDYLDF